MLCEVFKMFTVPPSVVTLVMPIFVMVRFILQYCETYICSMCLLVKITLLVTDAGFVQHFCEFICFFSET